MKILFIVVALLISVFGSNTATVQAACVWEQYKDGVLNDYLEIRNCVNLPLGQTACTVEDSLCGPNGGYISGWGDAPICPDEAVDGAASSKSNDYKCFKNKTVSPSIPSVESGMCYAFAFKTVCSTPPLPAPTISATPGSCGTGEITIEWGRVSGATAYEIRRDEGSPVNIGNNTRFVHSGLAAGTNYSFEVRALAGSTQGNWSTKKVATAPAACSPSVSASVDIFFR